MARRSRGVFLACQRWVSLAVGIFLSGCADPVPVGYGDECSTDDLSACSTPLVCAERVDVRGEASGTVCSIPCEDDRDCEYQPCNLGCWDDGYCAPSMFCR